MPFKRLWTAAPARADTADMAWLASSEDRHDPAGHRPQRSRVGRALLVAAGLVTIAASVQPWIVADTEEGPVTVLGVERYGFITLLLGILLVVVALLPPRPLGPARRWTAIVASISITVSALWDPTNVYQLVNGDFVRGAIQPALWVTAAAGLVALGGALLIPPLPPARPALPPWPVRPRPSR
jgi:hypothetical protein